MALSKLNPGQKYRLQAELVNTVVDLDAAAKARSLGHFQSSDPSLLVQLIVSGATTVTANQKFKYKLKKVFSAHSSTDWTGPEVEPGAVEFEGRNTWENTTRVGANAGYVASVSGLRAIPNGAVVWGELVEIDGAMFYRFSERNEPICP